MRNEQSLIHLRLVSSTGCFSTPDFRVSSAVQAKQWKIFENLADQVAARSGQLVAPPPGGHRRSGTKWSNPAPTAPEAGPAA